MGLNYLSPCFYFLFTRRKSIKTATHKHADHLGKTYPAAIKELIADAAEDALKAQNDPHRTQGHSNVSPRFYESMISKQKPPGFLPAAPRYFFIYSL